MVTHLFILMLLLLGWAGAATVGFLILSLRVKNLNNNQAALWESAQASWDDAQECEYALNSALADFKVENVYQTACQYRAKAAAALEDYKKSMEEQRLEYLGW